MHDADCNACPEYCELSRRQFLAVSSAAAPAWLPRVSFAKSHSSAAQDVIIQVYLRGGMDGLSALVPWNEPYYAAARPQIAVGAPGAAENTAVDLVTGNTAPSPTVGTVSFGVNKALGALVPMTASSNAYSDGKLLFVHACGLGGTNKSHFDAQKFMEVGKPNDTTIGTGWLGRHLLTQTMPINPAVPNPVLRAVGIADGLQKTLVGSPKALAVPDMQSNPGTPPALNNFVNYGLAGADATATIRTNRLSDMYAVVSDPLKSSALNTAATIAMLNTIGAAQYAPSLPQAGYTPTAYPTTTIGYAMRSSAALINANVGVEAIAIDYGGWDTHADEGGANGIIAGTGNGTMFNTMKSLADALAAFYADIIVGKGRNVTVVVMSEFGRRVGQNGTLGTDHGFGNMMMVLGSAVHGGRVITSWPGIAQSANYTGMDLGVTIDVRDILAEIVSARLGNAANLASVFPGYAPTIRGVFA